jgi:hypothetical protein
MINFIKDWWLMAVLVGLFVAVGLAFPEPPCAQGPCGNSCISSADCMEGCVCMNTDDGDLGICVSFN